MSVYLDYNASTPVDERVLEKMVEVYRNSYGNADSRTHSFGEQARLVVENSRRQVASLLAVNPDEIYFTSGATESNNIVIQGLREYAEKNNKKHIITSAIEHKSVLEPIKHLQKEGFEVDVVYPDESGRIDENKVLELVRADTLLVSIMHVNNETGIIQPIYEIGNALSETNVFFHVDATQSCGKLVEEIRESKYNMLSFSAHKMRGPQGVGVLVLKRAGYKSLPVRNVFFGGQQERGIRPGTIPVALVAGCGAACEISEKEYKRNEEIVNGIREEIIEVFRKSGINYSINGDTKFCIHSTINVCFDGVSSEALMISTKELCGISNGSACNSKNYAPSYVLEAMNLPISRIENSVRISWGADSDKNIVVKNIEEMLSVVKQMNE